MGITQASVFRNPEKWGKCLPEIAGKAETSLENARSFLNGILYVTLDDGVKVHKPDVLRDMKEICNEAGPLARLFGREPRVRKSPAFPLDAPTTAYFRETAFTLSEFRRFLPDLSRYFRWAIEDFDAELWLVLFRDQGMQPTPFEREEYGHQGAAATLRQRYPELAKELGPLFRKALDTAEVQVAWGLSTDFRSVTGQVQATLFHPLMGMREHPNLGFHDSGRPVPEAMREALAEAEKSALKD